jgi:hypothetical protein
MVTVEQVAAIAGSLPEVTVGERWGNRTWLVDGKVFAWERPFSKADVKRFGADPVPDGPILAVTVEDLGEKEAVLAARHRGFFTIEHFTGFPAVLVQLRVAAPGVVRDALVDGWLAVAPDARAEEFLAAERAARRR